MTTPDTFRNTSIRLNHGSVLMPAVGFGTLIPDPLATKQATKTALEVGFRHFDCAERYRNEEAVGEAMQEVFKAGTVRREDVFITTKLWNTNHRPERVKPAFDASRRRLRVDYIDCYIIHTPFAFKPGDEQDPRDEQGRVIYDSGVTLLETWRALERLVDEGHSRSIGLSDITLEKLREIVSAARIKPSVVQVESHPYLPEWELLDFCRQYGIVVALLPGRFKFGRCDVQVRPAFPADSTQVLAELFHRGSSEEPVAIVDLVNDKAGLQHNHMRNHGIVDGIGVFGDVEILLNNAPRIGEKRPVGSYSATIFVRLGDIVGADRDQPAIANLHLTMELQQTFCLTAIFWAEAAAAKDEHHRMISLQLGEFSMLCGMVSKFIVGKDSSGYHVGSHVKSSSVNA